MTEQKRGPGRPKREGGPDKVRSFRMGGVWDQALAKAGGTRELREVIERALARYVARG